MSITRERGARSGCCKGVASRGPPSACAAASAVSPAVENRSFGSLARALHPVNRTRKRVVGIRGIRRRIVCVRPHQRDVVLAHERLRPLMHSKRTQPSEYTSALGPTASPANCSGAIYEGVPTQSTVRVKTRVCDESRPAEVRQVGEISFADISEQDVVRLDVPMHKPTFMRIVERTPRPAR